MHFADDLMKKVEQCSSIVVGIDPDFSLMPNEFWPTSTHQEEVKSTINVSSTLFFNKLRNIFLIINLYVIH
jgi:hypothetical protein